jgi:hypothetical protein
VQGVEGSNPFTPTIKENRSKQSKSALPAFFAFKNSQALAVSFFPVFFR